MNGYEQFLLGKKKTANAVGVACEPSLIPPELYMWQRDVVSWAVRKGCAAIFADCGLGKTLMQIAFAAQITNKGSALIVAPLGVTGQTIREAEKLTLEIERIDGGTPPEDGIYITNYERLHKFNAADWTTIVLDESSILKSVDGKTRTLLLKEWTVVPYRLCCTATPAPNDVAELANHAEFLGAMSRVEMLASFFVHDDSGWRLKGHAHEAMWKWVASWAVWVRNPADIGHDSAGYDLPPLTVFDEVVVHDKPGDGELFASSNLGGVGARARMRRATMPARVERAAELINDSDEQWIVWCGLNDEGRGLHALIEGSALIEGKDNDASKLEKEESWRNGKTRVLITKPKIFGFGMNWQHCSNMLFLGLGDSYEQYYQAIRRCWRFGQRSPVEVVIVTSDAEGEVASNVKRKEAAAAEMAERITTAIRDAQTVEVRGDVDRTPTAYTPRDEEGDGWKIMLGDCVERIAEVPDDSIGLSVFSPPFATLYTYSNSDRDMGNCANHAEFFEHYKHLLPELLRVTQPGRRCATHVQQITTTKATHGVIGVFDFRAEIVRAMVAAGWIYDGEVVIDKCPQAQAIRTKAMQLLFATLKRDSNWLRPAMADYILLFRKPGENVEKIQNDDVSREEWIQWARPIWYGIRESDTLQASSGRAEKDERHICPLQLGTIERCIRLWSNKGDTILSPFAGIGSEGYQALKFDRRFIGVELKESYWKMAVRNLQSARAQLSLF